MARRLGFLGPSLVLLGAAVAAIGAWWMVHARASATAYLDVVALDEHTALAVRGERSTTRAFVELHRLAKDEPQVQWQALVPRYAGRPGKPGLAASRQAISVRVVRDGRAELFGLSMRNAAKLGGLRLAHERPQHPSGNTLPAAVTLFDGVASFELVGSEESPPWSAVAAIELDSGRERWHRDLGAEPVEAMWLAGDALWLRQGGRVHGLAVADGAPRTAQVPTAPEAQPSERVLLDTPSLRAVYLPASRQLELTKPGAAVVRHAWPSTASEPWPYHVAGGRLWVVFAGKLRVLALASVTEPGATLPAP